MIVIIERLEFEQEHIIQVMYEIPTIEAQKIGRHEKKESTLSRKTSPEESKNIKIFTETECPP
jgi:hypothetical protein